MAFTLCAPILGQLCNPRLSVFGFTSVGGTCSFEDTDWSRPLSNVQYMCT